MTADQLVNEIIRRELPPGIALEESRALKHAADRGGWTRAGITAQAAGEWLQLRREATVRELNRLTAAQIRQFYIDRHIMPFCWLADPLRALVADWSVTSGGRPVKAVQSALRRRGVYKGAVDGIAGPQTRAATAGDPDPRLTYVEVLAERVQFYVDIPFVEPGIKAFMKMHPKTQLHNVRGWVRRATATEFLLP